MRRTAICLVLISLLFTNHLHAHDNLPTVVRADCRPDDSQCLSPSEFEDARFERMKEGLFLVGAVIYAANHRPRLPRFEREYGVNFVYATSTVASIVLTIGGFGLAIYSFYSAHSPSGYGEVAKYALCRKRIRICNVPKPVAPKVEPQCPLVPGNSSLAL